MDELKIVKQILENFEHATGASLRTCRDELVKQEHINDVVFLLDVLLGIYESDGSDF